MKQISRLERTGAHADDRDDVSRVRSSLSLQTIATVAGALGARLVRGFSIPEEGLCSNLPPAPSSLVEWVKDAITSGGDPLGDQLSLLRQSAERRKQGATLTPMPIVHWMLAWAESRASPERVVDPGTGTGRLAVQAGLRFPRANILGIECDPLPALIARANLAAAGLEARSEVILGDYRSATVHATAGESLYIGNPPYVRHHLLEPIWK
jgi:adenine-specific DNA-methyltransferase